MADTDESKSREEATDVGAYCRRIEDHLTKVNGGHLVRVVGPGFDLVRQWAEVGIPLSVVFRGIDLKAERHRIGASKRPLRIEFCEADVREVFDHWRRAIGLMQAEAVAAAEGSATADAAAEGTRRSLSRHMDRAIERLSRIVGRLDLPEALRDAADRILQEIAGLRETSKRLRGDAREAAEVRLAELGADLAAAARRSAPADLIADLERQAARDLAPYRARLDADQWRRSVDLTVDRLLRAHFDLPLLEP